MLNTILIIAASTLRKVVLDFNRKRFWNVYIKEVNYTIIPKNLKISELKKDIE